MSNDDHNPKNQGSRPGNPNIVEVGEATRFAKGQSGNPSGRPSTKVLTQALRNRLEAPIPAELEKELDLPPKSTYAEAVAARLAREAAKGNIAAIREVYERLEGKPPKEVKSDDDNRVQINVVYKSTLYSLSRALEMLASRADDEEIKTKANTLKMLLEPLEHNPEAQKWFDQNGALHKNL